MITTWLCTGDKHGNMSFLNNLSEIYTPETTAIIILGDAGLNFYLNKSDYQLKQRVEDYGFTLYCVRGNHESRPTDIPNIQKVFDKEVNGEIWYEPEFPHIKYFQDFGIYKINGYYILVIGGAYSVDKWWRLARSGLQEENNNPKKSGWWNNEQLSAAERNDCYDTLRYANGVNHMIYDFVLTHTCPISYEPKDLFLPSVNQNTVDKSMELWLEDVKNLISWKHWLFGHYHADRIEAPYVEQFYHDIESFDDIAERWRAYDNADKKLIISRNTRSLCSSNLI